MLYQWRAHLPNNLFFWRDFLNGARIDQNITVGQKLHVMRAAIREIPERRAIFPELENLAGVELGGIDHLFRPRGVGTNDKKKSANKDSQHEVLLTKTIGFKKYDRTDGNQFTAIPADPTSGMPVLRDFSPD